MIQRFFESVFADEVTWMTAFFYFSAGLVGGTVGVAIWEAIK